MNTGKNVSRRNFIKRSSLGVGAGIAGVSSASAGAMGDDLSESKKLPREVCVASVDLKGLWPDTTRESRIKGILERMKEVDLGGRRIIRSEEHTSELQSHSDLVCRLLLEKKK